MEVAAADSARLRLWLDKLEITEVIYRLARAIDRCDSGLLADCFHPDATDDHGVFQGTAAEFRDWVIPELEAMKATQHTICNVLVDVDGDAARAESYFVAYHRLAGEGGDQDMIAAGRYLDRFERRNGVWRISHRHAVYDWNRLDPATDTWDSEPMKGLLARGGRAPDDPSYET